MAVIQLDEVDSTNKYALEHCEMLSSGTLIVASSQHAGRGRRGKSWVSPAGLNIYASYLIKDFSPSIGEASWIASLALLAFFEEVAPTITCWLKWPNDIYCGKKKIAGVLCEVKTSPANKIEGVVLGMGINVNMPKDVLDMIDQPATSILVETGHELDLSSLNKRLAYHLNHFYNEAQKESLYVSWKAANKLLGKEIELRTEGRGTLYGVAKDIGSNGEIIVKLDNGLESFHSGDVSIRENVKCS